MTLFSHWMPYRQKGRKPIPRQGWDGEADKTKGAKALYATMQCILALKPCVLANGPFIILNISICFCVMFMSA